MLRFSSCIVVVFLLAFGIFFPQSSLAIGIPGTRAQGMGEAFVAVADDTSALFYNPAGLAGKGGDAVIELGNQTISDASGYNYYDNTYLVVGGKGGTSNFGGGLAYVANSDDNAINQLVMGGGYKFFNCLSLGVGLDYLKRNSTNPDGDKPDGYIGKFGALFEIPYKPAGVDFRIGSMYQTEKKDMSAEQIAYGISAGKAFTTYPISLKISYQHNHLSYEGLDSSTDNIGGELIFVINGNLFKMVSLQSGYESGDGYHTVSVGLGTKLGKSFGLASSYQSLSVDNNSYDQSDSNVSFAFTWSFM